jgi:hypothetical protein
VHRQIPLPSTADGAAQDRCGQAEKLRAGWIMASCCDRDART